MQLKEKLMINLYVEYQKFNQSINEFYYCIGGIELNDTLLNPLLFETHQFGYKIHITNCCKLTLNDG